MITQVFRYKISIVFYPPDEWNVKELCKRLLYLQQRFQATGKVYNCKVKLTKAPSTCFVLSVKYLNDDRIANDVEHDLLTDVRNAGFDMPLG